MGYYNEKLRELREKVERHEQVKEHLEQLQKQRELMIEKVQTLKKEMEKEEKDVQRVEGPGIVSFYYDMTDQKYEKLDKEQQELVVKVAEYNAAVEALQALDKQIEKLFSERIELAASKEQYIIVENERMREIKKKTAGTDDDIEVWHEKIRVIKEQVEELEKLMEIGNDARGTCTEIQMYLEDAASFGTMDMIGFGVAGAIGKYSNFNTAEKMFNELREKLKRFKTNLVDIKVKVAVDFEIYRWVKWADVWCDDDTVADMGMLGNIERVSVEVKKLDVEIRSALDKIIVILREKQKQLKEPEARFKEIVENADV